MAQLSRRNDAGLTLGTRVGETLAACRLAPYSRSASIRRPAARWSPDGSATEVEGTQQIGPGDLAAPLGLDEEVSNDPERSGGYATIQSALQAAGLRE